MLAAQVRAEIVVLDVGVAEAPRVHPRLRDRAARRVTGDLMVEAAMTADEATAAVLAGADVAEELVGAGADLLVTGEMGVANTTAAATLTAAYTGAGAGRSPAGARASTTRRWRARPRSSRGPSPATVASATLSGFSPRSVVWSTPPSPA